MWFVLDYTNNYAFSELFSYIPELFGVFKLR